MQFSTAQGLQLYGHSQGDQIVIVDFGHFLIAQVAHILVNFFSGKRYVSILTKYGLGHILGDFPTNSSGHPGHSFGFRADLF
jgi:hypothetical protein